MKITEQLIPHIEKALGLKLYDHQVLYLLEKGNLKPGRVTGKTLAYCVRLSLSDGEPLDMSKPEQYADEISLRHHRHYSHGFFKKEFLRIRETLKDYGFTVRDVIHVNRR